MSKQKKKEVTFQKTMQLTVLIGQVFGLIPVSSVRKGNVLKLSFSTCSVKYLYSLISMLGQGVLVVCCIHNLFTDKNASLYENTAIAFYLTSFVTTILFFRLAMKWPEICQEIEELESIDPTTDHALIKKCNFSCILILSLAFLEHLLANLGWLVNMLSCKHESDLSFFDSFNLAVFSWVFRLIPYNTGFGVLTQLFNVQCTFNWNFSDVFLICISWYLASRIDQVNEKLKDIKGKTVPFSYWLELREHYTRATDLVIRVSDLISAIVFISFANNVFFICMQLLHTIDEGLRPTSPCGDGLDHLDNRPFHGYEQAVYFLYSFIFLVVRSTAVSLIASKVHTASRQPVNILYHVPHSSYCEEVKRFLDQVNGDVVALHGLHFFYIKRGMILSIAATIVTYELVMMQVAGVSPKSS